MSDTLQDMLLKMIAKDAKKWAEDAAAKKLKEAIGALPKDPDERDLDREAYYEEIDGEE
jgi:hypothetical protein